MLPRHAPPHIPVTTPIALSHPLLLVEPGKWLHFPAKVKRPVQVLVRARPVHLQAIHFSVEQADTTLIDKFCAKL